MTRRILLVFPLLATVTAIAFALPRPAGADDEPDAPAPHPRVEDVDAYLREKMLGKWSSVERRPWRIDYRPIAGLEGRSAWHIEGTAWWVRLYPHTSDLDELDKTRIYEIDAVAVNQNYGTIDFYVYDFPRKVEP